MNSDEIIQWTRNKFAPIPLSTPEETLVQNIEETIRYWNNHSAYKTADMVTLDGNGMTVVVPTKIKTVVQVYPAIQNSSIFQDHPLFSLLGIVLMDNITQDLIQLDAAFRTYRVYTGYDFRWTFMRSGDPAVGGKLMLRNLPIRTDRVCVVGTRRLIRDQHGKWEDITDEQILEWVLAYMFALTKKSEGQLLRKGEIVGIKSDGQAMFDEGEKDKAALEQVLRDGGRWVVMARRF
jgi:hypothetical protein